MSQAETEGLLLSIVGDSHLPNVDLYFADYATLNGALGGPSSSYCFAEGLIPRLGLDPTLSDPTLRLRDMFGFEACDIEATAIVYPPARPDAIIASRVSISPASVAKTLIANGYSTRVAHGKKVFSSAHDAKSDDRRLYFFNRIALLDDGVIVRAGDDASLELALERAGTDLQEANPDAAVLLPAIGEHDGLYVLGSHYAADRRLMDASLADNDFSRWGLLDRPERTALAYQRMGTGEDAMIVALLYRNVESAARSASELQLRLPSYVSPLQHRQFCDGVSVGEKTEGIGTVVYGRCVGGMADVWFRAVFSRDLLFLSERPPQ